jgi:dihydrofolate reductase
MRLGLVDDFELFVVGVVLGGGTPYFPPDVHLDLELVETRTFGETVQLHYRRRS